MKTRVAYSNILIGLLLTVVSLVSKTGYAQPEYDFRNPVLIAGTDRQAGAIYLFSNVRTGVDARVTLINISPGITVTELDGASGYPEALQPTLVADPHTTGYLEMFIQFVEAGTNTEMIQLEVPVTCIDVDGWANNDGLGNPLAEFDEVNMGGGYVDYQLTGGELAMSQSGTWFIGKNTGGIDYPGRDTAAKQVMFTAVNAHISSCTIRVGVDNPSTISGNRLRSVYFKKFKYPNSFLAKPVLLSFRGVEKNNAVDLQWQLEKGHNLKNILIEKGNGSNFHPIAEVNLGGKDDQSSFGYSDGEQQYNKTYYRLKMISTNGQVSYSNILSFNSGVLSNSFKVFPTRVQSVVTIQLKAEKSSTVNFQLVDYSGRVVVQKNISVQEGTNSITVNDLERLYPGNYVALIRLNNTVYSQKIFKP